MGINPPSVKLSREVSLRWPLSGPPTCHHDSAPITLPEGDHKWPTCLRPSPSSASCKIADRTRTSLPPGSCMPACLRPAWSPMDISRNHLVPTLVECGSLPDARHVFDSLTERNEYSWSSLISGYTESGDSQHALHLYHQMQTDHVSPNRFTFLTLLRSCARTKEIVEGRGLHADIVMMGMDGDLFLHNSLLDMYGKCGLVTEASNIFGKLHVRDAVSWTALITAYVEHGLGEEALRCFEQMHMEGFSPDAVTAVCSLKACSSIGAMEKGQLLCTDIVGKGLEKDAFVGSTMVDMYAKCGLLIEAQELSDHLPARNMVSWTALIAGYAEHGPGEKAVACLEQMQFEGFSPDAVTFACTLKACGSTGLVERGRQLRAEIAEKGLESDYRISNTLVDMFGKCGSLIEARDVFDKLLDRDAVSWTALISGYCEHGYTEEGLASFQQMQLEGMPPSKVTFLCALKACATLGVVGRGRELHVKIKEMGFERDLSIANTLVDMFSKCNSLEEAQKVFDNLPLRDVVSWNTLIAGYAEYELSEEALTCFERLQLEGIPPNAVTYIGGLKACGQIGALGTGQVIHSEIIKRGLEREPFLDNTLVDMYAKCGTFADAHESLEGLPVRSPVSWSALISGYAERGKNEQVLKCFKEMQLEGISADAVTLVHCLKSCSTLNALERGREIHAEARRLGLDRGIFVGNMLIDMYSKCGSLAEGRQVFNNLLIRDVVSWSTMIKGYSKNHESLMAVQCFEDMVEEGVKPDAISFTCLLDACSHASLVDDGQEYFKMMIEHRIEPTLDHYVCMVDLLARSGHINDAEKFVASMQCPPSKEILKALLSACKIYGEVKLGLKCFDWLIQVNLEDSAAYLLIADTYASTGRRIDAKRIEETRKDVGAKKKLAAATIEVDNRYHEFTVGHSQSNVISTRMESLTSCIKDEGYVPNLQQVFRILYNEEKEETLCEHVHKQLMFHNHNDAVNATTRISI